MSDGRSSFASCAGLLLIASGCASLTPEAVTEFYGGSGGEVTNTLASTPDASRVSTYAASCAASTLMIPVTVKVENADLQSSVVRVNVFGSPGSVGVFTSGRIVEQEFRKVAKANFREPIGDELPVARLVLRIMGVSVRQESFSSLAKATVRLVATLKNRDGSEEGYSKEFSETASRDWSGTSQVPASFDEAVAAVVKAFLDDWGRSDAGKVLQNWFYGARGGVTPPELKSLDWLGGSQKGMFSGRCVVACNGYEGFRAKTWAAAQIASECRRQLGNIEQERVRVVYDEKESRFDSTAKTWSIVFKTFARTPYVLYYDKIGRSGYIIGDLELLGLAGNLQAASEKLKDVVLAEMDKRAGSVPSDVRNEVRTGKAKVRFGDFTTDRIYNTVTIAFNLVY